MEQTDTVTSTPVSDTLTKPKLRKDASPWTERILEVLADGEWHDYKEVRDAAARLVPPGIAFRQAEKNRVRHFERTGRPIQDRKYGSNDDTILSGQRSFVNKGIAALVKHKRIEVEYGTQPKRKRAQRLRLAN